jgi:Cu/Ag efflux protein CusF
MKARIVLPVVLAAAAVAPLAFAQQAQPPVAAVVAASAPGVGGVAGTVQLQATVVALDAATRTVTLKGAKGRVVDVVVPPESKNFDQIRVGDLVTVDYMRALTLELRPHGSGIRSSSSETATAPAPAGAVAGGAAGRQVVIMANVTAVDKKASVVTLRGPKGNSVELHVPDPAQLARVKVGDQVEAVYTEAVAISVDRVAKPAGK